MWLFFGFGTICIITDHEKHLGRIASFSDAASHPPTFTEINTTPQVFLFFIIMQMVPNLKTHDKCAFLHCLETFIVTFSGGNIFVKTFLAIVLWIMCQVKVLVNELWIKNLFIRKKAQLSLSHHYCWWFSWWPISVHCYCWCCSWSRYH